jgi:hypothetical protein
LLSVQAVPLETPGLAQQIRAAHWRFALLPGPDQPAPLPQQWSAAIAALLEATTLPWRDQDKKGRPRERDCRPYLLALGPAPLEAEGPGQAGLVLDLEAAVDPQGRSLRPEQLRQWLGESLGLPLVLGAVQRRCLRLEAC